jgi:hypothetical protein
MHARGLQDHADGLHCDPECRSIIAKKNSCRSIGVFGGAVRGLAIHAEKVHVKHMSFLVFGFRASQMLFKLFCFKNQ